MPKQDLYISVDIEADGPAPGLNSMLSIGVAAFTLESNTPVFTYTRNLRTLPQAHPNPDTSDWWLRFPAAFAAATSDPQSPTLVFQELQALISSYKHLYYPVLVVWPTWDYMWLQWYQEYTGIELGFGLAALDIKTLAHLILRTHNFRSTVKRNMPSWVFNGAPQHTHIALDDAIEQGIMLVNLLNHYQSEQQENT